MPGFAEPDYDFAKRNLHYVQSKLDADGDLWPEGSGNVERTGMGPEIWGAGFIGIVVADTRTRAVAAWLTRHPARVLDGGRDNPDDFHRDRHEHHDAHPNPQRA